MDEGDGGLVLLADDLHAGGDGGRQRRGDELRRIGGPVDDVDLLRSEVLHDGAHTSAAGADQGTLGVDAIGVGADGDLGAGAGLAGDGHDRHGAGHQFRDLALEQATHQLGVRTGDDDLGALDAARHVDDIHAQTLAMTVTLTGHLLATGQNRLDIADGDMHVRRIAGILLNDAGDELALLAGEGAEDLVVLGLTEQLSDDLARGGRGEAPEVARGVVVLLAQLRCGMRVILGGLHRDLLTSPHGERACPRVEFDTGMLGRMRCFQIGQTQRLFQCGVQLFEIDSLLDGELMHSCQVQFHTQDLL